MSKNHIALAILLIAAAAAFLIGFSYRTATIAHGCFHQVAHKGRGCATLIRQGDGKTVLQLTDFATTENSSLRVLLISAEDALENATVLNSLKIDLGPLQSSSGVQEYVVPRSVDVAQFNAVTIWNERHQVNFTTAPLQRR
jgi:tRNA-binding EMAP/Myf-like protein